MYHCSLKFSCILHLKSISAVYNFLDIIGNTHLSLFCCFKYDFEIQFQENKRPLKYKMIHVGEWSADHGQALTARERHCETSAMGLFHWATSHLAFYWLRTFTQKSSKLGIDGEMGGAGSTPQVACLTTRTHTRRMLSHTDAVCSASPPTHPRSHVHDTPRFKDTAGEKT